MGNGDGARPFDREKLAAFADGEFGPETARLVMHLADNPEDQAYVDRIAVERALIARAFGSIADEPVPERILAVIEGRTPRGARVLASPFRRWSWFAAGLAAGVATAAAAVLAVRIGGPPDAATEPVGVAGSLAVGPVAPGSALARALDSRASGDEIGFGPDARLRIAASFLDGRKRICREIMIVRDAAERVDQAVVCAEGSGWSVDIAVGSALESGEDAYAPASGPGGRAIERLLDEIGAGSALGPEEEDAARARGWRP